MADNNNVTIDASYFNHLFTRAVERERLWSDRECLVLECEKIAKERDELKAKLSTAKNYEAVIAAKDREIEAVKEERNRLNAKVNELKDELKRYKIGYTLDACQGEEGAQYKRLAAAERCIEDCWGHIACGTTEAITASLGAIEDIIRAYREKEEAGK